MKSIESKAIRLLKNDKAHAHRYKDIEDIELSKNKAVAPDWLSEEAKVYFDDFVEVLEEMYPASASFTEMIAEYADNEERLQASRVLLKQEGQTYETHSATGFIIKEHPLVKIVNDCITRKIKILSEFGFSAVSSARIKLKKQEAKKENPFAMIENKAQQG